jgi:hypothetical protein
MMKKKIGVGVKKIGQRKLIIYLPKNFREECKFNFGDLVKLEVSKGNKKAISISKFHYIISLKKEIISSLNLIEGNIIQITIIKIIPLKKPKKLFNKGKIDLLFLMPDITRKGSEVFMEEIYKNTEPYLRICSFHKRGSGAQTEIRRYIDINLFGRFLGQLQAEGTKGFLDRLEFCNKSLKEHEEYLSFLNHLGIAKNKIITKLDYHEDIKNINQEIKKFEKFLKYKLNYVVPTSKSRGGFGFKIIVRNTLLTEFILGSMDRLRILLANKIWDSNLKLFAEGFFAKILDGDGSLEIITKNRNVPQARLTISDGNLRYLEDYKLIMEKFSFAPKINTKWRYIRSYVNPTQAKNLYDINVFKENANFKKLKFFLDARNKFTNK